MLHRALWAHLGTCLKLTWARLPQLCHAAGRHLSHGDAHVGPQHTTMPAPSSSSSTTSVATLYTTLADPSRGAHSRISKPHIARCTHVPCAGCSDWLLQQLPACLPVLQPAMCCPVSPPPTTSAPCAARPSPPVPAPRGPFYCAAAHRAISESSSWMVCMGIAKLTPSAAAAFMLFMPTTSPSRFTSGPPLRDEGERAVAAMAAAAAQQQVLPQAAG